MNDIADYSERCKELDAEYSVVGRDLLQIKVCHSDQNIGIVNRDSPPLVYCCLFNAACVTLQDTLFLLQADADEYCMFNGKRAIVVIGVHKDWIDYKSNS